MNEQNKSYNREEFLADAQAALEPSMKFFAENVSAKLNEQETDTITIEELKSGMPEAIDAMKKIIYSAERARQNKDKE